MSPNSDDLNESQHSNSVAIDDDEHTSDFLLSSPEKPRQRRASLSSALPGAPMVHKKGRRASMGPMPTPYTNHDYQAATSRRTSLNGVMLAGRPISTDGYEDETDGEQSRASMRSMQRRASLKAQRRASAGNYTGYDGPPKRPPIEEPQAMPKHSRRGSAGPGVYGGPTPMSRLSRRGSAGPGYNVGYHSYEGPPAMPIRVDGDYKHSKSFDDLPSTHKQNRRGSAGGNIPRRMSASRGGYDFETGPMPRRMSRRGSAGLAHAPHGQPRPPSPPNPPSRMPRRASGPKIAPQRPTPNDDSETSEELANPYGYGDSGGPGYITPYTSGPKIAAADYGYGDTGGRQTGLMSRRGSNGSRVSQASRRSQRRNSTVILPNHNAFSTAEILTNSAIVPESDLDDSENDYESSSRNRRPSVQPTAIKTGANMYGYEAAGSALKVYGYGDDSASDSDVSYASSTASHKRSRRRNSCIVPPNQDPRKALEMSEDVSRMSDRDLLSKGVESEDEMDDWNDPDSLLSRSGFGKKDTCDDDLLLDNTRPKGVTPKKEVHKPLPLVKETKSSEIAQPVNPGKPTKGDPKKSGAVSNESWNRSRPFTTSYLKPTAATLDNNMNTSTRKIATEGWGELQLESSEDSSSGESSEGRYGPRMYVDSEYFEEIDKYKQRARSHESITEEMVSIEKRLMEISKLHPRSNLRFQAAEGFDNASDYILRVFTARLRQGITVMKHNKSRWSKSTYRVLKLMPDGKTLTWKPLEGEQDKGKRPKIDLSKCLEVRHAFSRDPDTRKLTGTPVLRKRCKDNMSHRSMALIFRKRTLDMTALNTDQCKVMMEGFSALCFRLRLAHMDDDSPDLKRSDSVSMMSTDDDFASTVYGDTVSITMSKTSGDSKDAKYQIPISPWGL